MSDLVKVKIRPGQSVKFPGKCIHCAQPATGWFPLTKRRGRLTRFIDVPICTACVALQKSQTAMEARWRGAGWVAGVIILLLTFWLGNSFLPLNWFILRLFVSLGLALLLAFLVWQWIQRLALAAATPAKQALLAAAHIETFSWRATTFAFRNEDFRTSFTVLNEAECMELEE